MALSEKIRILLADEDALRRDGLAAVLQANAGYEVVAQCPDGESALTQMRQLRPDVAVLDLNLPKLHGIELVRRVRGEMLGTKIVIMAGTTDDDIVREVVRAGADAYLLKNGPARHLTDAISYVRDGGQYFSPQLRRDGVNRHLLEEPARIPVSSAPATEQHLHAREDESADGGKRTEPRETRDSRYSRSPRYSGRGGSRDRRLRERIRENAPSPNLEERDYEILDMMAEGIRPILDRLEEIEGRIGDMESGETAVPGNVRGWLSSQIADTFQDTGSISRELAPARSINEIEARLPKLIEDAVTARFQNMAGKLQQEIEETHLRTLETFVKNIQVKLVQRVSALETDMTKQAEAMKQLREYSQRTEDNLGRLISGVDKLAQELPRRLLPASEVTASEPILQDAVSAPQPGTVRNGPRKIRRRISNNQKVLIFWVALIALVIGIVAIVQLTSAWNQKQNAVAAQQNAPGVAAAPPQKSFVQPARGADTKTKMQAAGDATERKDYSMAEDIYKQVLQTEPNNVDAMKALASVLYREDKIEESAAVLDKLPKTN
jgi:DNA-binding NarL/FixJ family response regulator/TolA-binding protein